MILSAVVCTLIFGMLAGLIAAEAARDQAMIGAALVCLLTAATLLLVVDQYCLGISLALVSVVVFVVGFTAGVGCAKKILQHIHRRRKEVDSLTRERDYYRSNVHAAVFQIGHLLDLLASSGIDHLLCAPLDRKWAEEEFYPEVLKFNREQNQMQLESQKVRG